MEALNAVGLIPASVLCRSKRNTNGILALPTTSSLKLTSSATSSSTNPPSIPECLSRGFNGGLVLVSSFFISGLAKALTYEEALQQTISTSTFDVNGVLDGFINFATENPTILAGGVTALAVPLVLSQVLRSPKPWGVESARKAYSVIGDDVNAQLLDIRAPVEFRQVGSPDIRGLGKKPVSIFYKGEDKPGFLKKLSLKFKEPESTTLFILEKFDGNSELVAELVTVNGFKAAYGIKDGADGPRGWKNSGLPWIPPKKLLSLDAITDAFGDGADALPVALGIAAAAGLGVLVFSEAETILQILGSAATVQFASTKLLFAEERKKTLEQVGEFVSSKVAPNELVDDIKQIGTALLPTIGTSKALPAPPQPVSATATSDSVQKAEASAEPVPQINSVPKVEVTADSEPKFPRPLSPYPYYPDFKPPSSPSPSQP